MSKICFITFIVIIIGFIIFEIVTKDFDGISIPIALGLGAIVGFLVFVILAVAASIAIFSGAEREEYVEADVNIISLEDNYHIEGSGCLFYSHIDEKFCYSFMCKDNTGGMKAYSVPANKSTIYYIKNDEIPHVQYCKTAFTNPILIALFENDEFVDFSERTYKIYIPVGGVIEKYNVDLQ